MTVAAASKVDELAARFIALTLTKPEWTHHAHLRVGLWHLLHHSPEEALALLRTRIRALNESHGVANSPTGGYHESITRFYVWQIASFLREKPGTGAGFGSSGTGTEFGACPRTPVDELAEELIARFGAKELPFRYWSKERLMSVEARAGWVEPDLAPLTPLS